VPTPLEAPVQREFWVGCEGEGNFLKSLFLARTRERVTHRRSQDLVWRVFAFGYHCRNIVQCVAQMWRVFQHSAALQLVVNPVGIAEHPHARVVSDNFCIVSDLDLWKKLCTFAVELRQ